MIDELGKLNALSAIAFRKALHACCGCDRWVELMLQARPYKTAEDLYACAEKSWGTLGEAEFLEACSHHPQIGGRSEEAESSSKDRHGKWAAQEQSGVQGAQKEILARLAALNVQYREKFGFIYLVCATGKSAAEMLGILEARLKNSRDQELKTAATEQSKITKLRLEKLLKS